MSTSRSWHRPSTKSIATIICTVFISAIALIYFLPHESKFGYVYEQGKPWRYSQLIADYNFPILKTKTEVDRERDSVMRQFMPYFMLDSVRAQRHIEDMVKAYRGGEFTNMPFHYLPRLRQLFETVYRRGVIDGAIRDSLRHMGMRGVRVIRGKYAESFLLDSVMTTAEAYKMILNYDHRSTPTALSQSRFERFLMPNLRPDVTKTRLELDNALKALSATSGMVQAGQTIIDRGNIVTAEHAKILDSYKHESEQRNDPSHGSWLILLGQAVFVLCIITLLIFYLKLFRRDYLDSPHTILLFFSLVTIFPVITYLMVKHSFWTIYIVPYAIVPMFVRIFMDSRTAYIVTIATSLLSALVLHSPFEFLLWQIMTGMVVIYSMRELTERSQLLRVTFIVVVSGIIVLTTYDLSQGLAEAAFDLSRLVSIIIGGLLLLFAYPLLYIVEKVFSFTSGVTLVELTNINNNILRKMSKVAQGTFNHSMQVANLAAEVADKIGASAQLARTGALYHDIGKTLNPAFFTENQSGVNPHDSLTEERSAQIIISHVTDGVRLAEKYRLPQIIREFITTHHGRGMTKYFYIQYCNKHPGEEVDTSLFTYPGPNPQTREQAILMMCDSVEAASRSLREYTEESISALVDKIIDGQLNEGCFRECPITFRDIADAKRVLVDSLKTIYHTRISYPEMNRPNAEQHARTGLFGTGLHRTWKR